MKYTKNIGNKLKLMGFSYVGNNDDCKDDETLSYEVWRKGEIDVTVEHSPKKKVYVEIPELEINPFCHSLEDLRLLDRMINPKPKKS